MTREDREEERAGDGVLLLGAVLAATDGYQPGLVVEVLNDVVTRILQSEA